jgi:hypothetical protein
MKARQKLDRLMNIFIVLLFATPFVASAGFALVTALTSSRFLGYVACLLFGIVYIFILGHVTSWLGRSARDELYQDFARAEERRAWREAAHEPR